MLPLIPAPVGRHGGLPVGSRARSARRQVGRVHRRLAPLCRPARLPAARNRAAHLARVRLPFAGDPPAGAAAAVTSAVGRGAPRSPWTVIAPAPKGWTLVRPFRPNAFSCPRPCSPARCPCATKTALPLLVATKSPLSATPCTPLQKKASSSPPTSRSTAEPRSSSLSLNPQLFSHPSTSLQHRLPSIASTHQLFSYPSHTHEHAHDLPRTKRRRTDDACSHEKERKLSERERACRGSSRAGDRAPRHPQGDRDEHRTRCQAADDRRWQTEPREKQTSSMLAAAPARGPLPPRPGKASRSSDVSQPHQSRRQTTARARTDLLVSLDLELELALGRVLRLERLIAEPLSKDHTLDCALDCM